MRRVVVTGMGIVCPWVSGVEHVWRRLVNAESGISAIQAFDTKDLPCKVAGQVPARHARPTASSTSASGSRSRTRRRWTASSIWPWSPATEAVEDSGWMPETEEDRCATGVMIGSGIGGLETIYEASLLVHSGKARRLSPFFIPSALINLASGNLSIKYGFKGPNHAVVTACATGVHAIGDAARLIMLGRRRRDGRRRGRGHGLRDRHRRVLRLARACPPGSTIGPPTASRPWDKDRDGFVMGEGAGVVVLEEYEHAQRRGAKIYAEIGGYGMSGDAYHITAPAEGHEGAFRSMKAAMKNGGVRPEDIQYVNAHGTSTPLGDDLELEAVERLFGDAAAGLAMSSTKSATGHLLGAAGAVEAIFSILAIRDGVAPPTLNLDERRAATA